MFLMRFDMRAPDFGASTTELYAAALEMAAWADRLGCVSIAVSEHHGSPDGYLPSPLTMAAAMAARTELTMPGENVLAHTAHLYQPGTRRPYGVLEWPAMLRLLDAEDRNSGYPPYWH